MLPIDIGILMEEAVEDQAITQPEITGMITSIFDSAITGIVAIGMMSMAVRAFYDILGKKKLAKQEEEVLEIVGEVW